MRRAPDYFVPRSFLFGNSGARSEPGAAGHGTGRATAATRTARVGESWPGGDPRPPLAWPCPPWAAVEAPEWGIPALQGERVHATACSSVNFSPRSAEPVATRGCACRVSGFSFLWAALASCPARAAARHADLAVFLAAQWAGRRAHLAEREGRLRAGLAWRLA